MSDRVPIRSEIWQGESITTLADVRSNAGTSLTSTNAPTWSLTVWGRSAGYGSPQTALYTLSSQPTSTVLLGAYATSAGWTQNATGFNFQHTIGTSAFAQRGGTTVRLEYALSTSTEGVTYIVHECKILSMMHT